MSPRVLFLPLLLLLGVAPAGLAGTDEGTVRSEALNFEISMPDSIDWERGPQPDNQAVKVLFQTEYADSDPPAVCEVQLLVIPLTKDQVHMKIENLARQWSESMEGAVTNPRELREEPDKLGGQDAFMRDVKGDYILFMGSLNPRKNLAGMVEAFRTRPLESRFPYIWVDATYEKVRIGGRVVSQALIAAKGLTKSVILIGVSLD